MRNRLTFPSGGTEPKYVWDRYALQNNGVYVWDTHNVIQDDVYYWDKYAIKGKSSYTWDKYDVIETSYYSWNKYAVRETTDYAWNYWKCSWHDVYFVFTDTTYELEAQADYTFTNGYLHFYTGPDEKKTYSVASIINNNASLRGILAKGIYGFRYSTSSVIYYAQPDYLANSTWSELYVENGAVKITSVQKIKTGSLRQFSPTKPANLNYDYAEAPFVSYPSEIIDTYTALSNDAYPVNAYDAGKNYYYEAQNDGFWNTSTIGIVADKSQILETYTSTNKNAYTAGLYPTYLLTYAGETVEYSKGNTHRGTVTSSNGGAYPKDGKQGDYWYVMQLSGNYVWNTYNTAPVQTWDKYKTTDSNQLLSATGTKAEEVQRDITVTFGYFGYGDGPERSGNRESYYASPSIIHNTTLKKTGNLFGITGSCYVKDITDTVVIFPDTMGDVYEIESIRETNGNFFAYVITNTSKCSYDATTDKTTIDNLVCLSINTSLGTNLDNGFYLGTIVKGGYNLSNIDSSGVTTHDIPLMQFSSSNTYIGDTYEVKRYEKDIGDGATRLWENYIFHLSSVRKVASETTESVTVDETYADYEAIRDNIALHATLPAWCSVNGYVYHFNVNTIKFIPQIGVKYGSVTSTDRYAYPDNGELNGYWYVHSGVIPDATSFIGTVESRDKNTYPLNGELNGIYYVYSHLVDDTIVKGDFIEPVSSSNKNAFPQDNVSGDYWYVYSHMTTDYFCGDKNGTVNAETKQAYPVNAKLGDIWYVYSHFENNGPYKSRWVDEIETNIRSTYPTNGIQGNYWYVYKKTYTGYKLQINDWQIRGGVDYKHNINPEKDFTIGCVSSAEIAFNYDNTEDDFQKYLDADYCDYWTWQPEDTEWRLLGRFWLTDAEYERKNVKVKAFDAILATDTYVDDFIANTTYPITLTDFFNSLCNFLGVVGVINSKVVNRHIAFPDNFEAINITARQLFQYIAEMGGAFIQANTAGQIYLTTYTATGTALDNSQYTSYAKQRYNVEPISGLTVKMNTDDLGVSSGDIETNPYIIENNPLFYAESTSEIQAPVDVLYNSIKTKVYRPATINLLQDFNINCGDIITVNGNTFYVMSKELSASGCKLECFGNQYRDKKPQSINSDIVALRGKTNELYRDLEKTQSTLTDTANGLQSQITQTANEINLRVTNEVEGLESEITQTAESINLRVTNEVAGLESKITQTADSITSTVTDEINEAKSEIKQTTDSISLTVQEQGDLVAQLVLDVDGISARGYVTFTDLAGSGTTVINGDNITTGTINADRINMTGAISWGDLSNSCQNTIASFAGSDADVPDYIGPTSISAVDIMSPRIYGGTISAGTTSEGYMKMSSSGMDFKSDTGGNLMGIGFYPGRYNYPYIIFGDGVDSIGTDRGMIKKYAWGIWIGDNDGQLNDEPTGTGIMIDFVNHRVLKYENGTPAEL